MIVRTSFYFPLTLVNITRFFIRGMGFPTFAILAGVFEMVARVLADVFLIPAYFYVRKKLAARNEAATIIQQQ